MPSSESSSSTSRITARQGLLSQTERLLDAVVGTRRAAAICDSVALPSTAPAAAAGYVSRVEISMVLALTLFEDVCNRVPMARAFVSDQRRSGVRSLLDHGALRTIAAPSGALPAGKAAIERFLLPLGYELRDTYPLTRIAMTGFAYAHVDLPEQLPQYFVSEFHPESFSSEFQAALNRVVQGSQDPLPSRAQALLGVLDKVGGLPFDDARALVADLYGCFDRHHDEPSVEDYDILVAESPEAAWIATEGHAFNHATNRVADVGRVAEEQRRLGRPVKDAVERSRSGRVLQTAFRAATVDRLFVDRDGQIVVRQVPGSFHEFITRLPDESGALDLSFDAGNAQGIFAMTRKAPSSEPV